MHEAALAGLKEHDRLVLARGQVERRLRSRRASSKLPRLIERVLSRPFVSTSLIQGALKVSRQGALNLIGAFNLREITGRGAIALGDGVVRRTVPLYKVTAFGHASNRRQ
jgi:hypothetical protein